MVIDKTAGKSWIAEMAPDLKPQQELLGKLLDNIAADPMYRWLLVGCSLGRNAGDKYSDIDAGVGIADEAWPAGVQAVELMLRSIGNVVDTLNQKLPDELGRERRHLITVYEGNLQLSLVVSPSSMAKGLREDGVALYDPDGKLSQTWHPPTKITTPEMAREWAFLAWLELADAAKYLQRGSLWEALSRLNSARHHVWQLSAIASGLDYATYGVTQIIDDHASFPIGMESTVPALDKQAITDACVKLMDILNTTMYHAHDKLAFDLPHGMAATARNTYREFAA